MKRNIKLISNTDFDGYGCEYVFLMNSLKVEATHINDDNTNEINKMITEYINQQEYRKYSITFITGLTILETNILDLIDKANKENNANIIYINNEYIMYPKTYYWMIITDKFLLNETCCSELLYQYLLKYYKQECDYYALDEDDTNQVIEYIRLYTIKEINDDSDNANKFHRLFEIFGPDDFWNNLVNSYDLYEFMDKYYYLLDIVQKESDIYINKKIKELSIYDIEYCKVGIVFANKYIDKLSTALIKEIKEKDIKCDVVAIIGEDNIIYRSVYNLVCDEFAKLFNGSGGLRTATSSINNKQKDDIVKLLFANPNKKEDPIIKD